MVIGMLTLQILPEVLLEHLDTQELQELQDHLVIAESLDTLVTAVYLDTVVIVEDLDIVDTPVRPN